MHVLKVCKVQCQEVPFWKLPNLSIQALPFTHQSLVTPDQPLHALMDALHSLSSLLWSLSLPFSTDDEPATTCEALRHIANDTDLECDTSEGDDCDTMKCDTVLNSFPITTTYKVLPCNDPPAIRVVVEAAGTTVVDKVVSESQEISVVANLVTANVTLDQLDTSIGFQVRFK